jgi:hypothetical protein
MRLVARVVLLLIVLLASAAHGQTVSGTVVGTVTDSTGLAVPGVDINAKSEQTDLVRTTKTNAEGYYVLTFLPPGTYEVTANIKGFQTIVKKAVAIDVNQNTVSDFRLQPAAVASTVEVTGETPLLETTQGDVKHTLADKQVEDLPLAGRNFVSLVEQIPGFQNAPWIGSSNNPTNSTGSYAVFNGMGSRAATFQVDGVNNDDSSENQNRQNVNPATIKEVHVTTNSFSAEYGRAAGAVIQVQTKSGSNLFHGDVYDYMQSDGFNANTFFGNQLGRPKGAVDRNNYGWVINGPVKKNKLFFLQSGDRVRSVGTSSITRFIWLPSDTPHVCGPGEVSKPGGPYCLDPATHPNASRDIQFMKSIMGLWNTDELKGKTPNDPVACADMIASGRQNRCVTVDGIGSSFPTSDYTGKLDWNAPWNNTVSLRYQYSRRQTNSGRIIEGDNYGITNNRQYNIGLTLTHVFSPRQTGEFRFGFGNRTTLQDVVDGNSIPTIRFSSTLYSGIDGIPGTVIGTSTNVPINRRQHDTQFVYNHTMVLNRHTLKAGTDVRMLLLDDTTGDRSRGYWTFGTLDSLANIRALTGYTGWENFLRGYVTGYQVGFGNPYAQNRYKEGNLYFQDDFRVTPRFTLNLGMRWEGVGAPHELMNRFSYGFSGDYNNFEPRFGFAWRPTTNNSWLRHITGGPDSGFVIKGGYGILHGRMFQSIFSQNQLSIRTQPPNGFARDFSQVCPNEISDPSCGFSYTPGTAQYSTATSGGGVSIKGGQMQGTLLVPDPGLHLNYNQTWNLAIGRNLDSHTALEITYNGNRGIGNLFYDSANDARFPIVSPLVSVDVGGGNYQPVVFDRVCRDASDPICQTLDGTGNVIVNSSGTLKSFSALNSTTATLAQKGIVIENGVPHGYISLNTPQTNYRRPDPTHVRNSLLRNFGWNYYHGLILKLTRRYHRGLWFSASYTFSKAIDTGSEATYTGVDTNAPTGKNNAARSLRGLSSYDARNAFVFSYGYELPWMRSQKGIIGRIIGGWMISGTTTFRSGTPYSVTLGYDANLDGLGGDRPMILDPRYLYRSVDNGRAQSPCPTAVAGPCPDTISQQQLPGNIFWPNQGGTINADQRIITVGTDGAGTIGRNMFFTQGQNNFDTRFSKSVAIRERLKFSIQMEFYNLMNRVTFGVPSTTVLSSTPMGRITGTRNVNGFVDSGRSGGSRAGQLVLKLTF